MAVLEVYRLSDQVSKKPATTADKVREFIGSRIVPPELIADPATGQQYLKPAEYSFDGVHETELERIARAASAASGVVPSVEDLTAQAMVQLQAQQQQAQAQGGQAPPGA